MVVAILIIGLLLVILLPAIQRGRVSARTLHCKNNLRQIGLAMQSYHDTHRTLPPGMFNYLGADISEVTQPDGTVGMRGPARSCWMQRILPYIDQQPLYAQLPFDSNVRAYEWGKNFGTPIWTIVPQLMCPSDPANPKNVSDQGTGPENSQGFFGNIAMCAGSTDFGVSDLWKVDGTYTGDNLNGMFYSLSSVRFADVTDGLTSTVMGSELIINQDGRSTLDASGNTAIQGDRDTRGRYYNSHRGNALFSTQFPPNTSVPDEVDFCVQNPASPCNTSGSSPTQKVQYARSYHPGGANVVMGDASVRFISENISTEVFRSLGSRAGGEKPGEF